MNYKDNFRIKKSLGQHFLIDKNIQDKIINSLELGEKDFVVEVGSGFGNLTEIVSKKAKEVIAIEIDKNLAEFLKRKFSTNKKVKVINSDVLEIKWKEILKEKKKYKVVGNIPYYITSPLLTMLLEEKERFTFFVLMLQKEFAERIVAKPSDKNYGAISVFVQYYTEPVIIHIVKKSCFFPQPKVDSAIVKINLRKNPKIKILDEEFFFKIVKAIFQNRRKIILNSLLKANNLKLKKENIEKALNFCKIDKLLRGETLEIEKLGVLSDVLSKFNN